jgi:serine phosphatase RsbU (regulator of sigma subunit)
MEDGLSLSINIAVAKTNKYASRESGDTVEFAERPGGGMSVVIVDGQGSGIGAKALSMQLTSKAVSLLKEGVRDGAVARAVHDSLFAFRRGQVSADLDILSVDLKTRSVLVTRNSDTPMTIHLHGEWKTVPPTSGPIGLYHFTRPSVTQLQAEAGLIVILTSDGVPGAGELGGKGIFEISQFVSKSDGCDLAADELADRVLREAIDRDNGRPRDDLSVVVLILTGHVVEPLIRRMTVFVPLP